MSNNATHSNPTVTPAALIGPNKSRNPTKKRGRPPHPLGGLRKYLTGVVGSRNRADMVMMCKGLAPDLHDELMSKASWGRKKGTETTVGVVAYLARLPHAEQREAFEMFKQMGARFAKRYVECLNRPPSVNQMVKRIVRWLTTEFPPGPVDYRLLEIALDQVGSIVRTYNH